MLLAELPGSARAEEVHEALGALEGGGTESWEHSARELLRSAYDRDGSELVDTTEETEAIPCGTWLALDEGARERFDHGLRTAYGFKPGFSWLGDRLGIAAEVRSEVDSALVGCGLGGGVTKRPLDGLPEETTEPAAPTPSSASSGPEETTAARVRAVPNGGSTAWDRTMKPLLLAAYDADLSGWIDSKSEVLAIDCEVWEALDRAVRERWAQGLRHTYGFDANQLWVGTALGLSEGTRAQANRSLFSCVPDRNPPE